MKPLPTRYKILASQSKEDLEILVDDSLDNGWALAGGLAVDSYNNVIMQAVCLIERSFTKKQ